MSINTTIWGAPENWVDSRNNSDLDSADVKVGADTYNTYAAQWSNNRIELNNIDISPCFWGISADSIWGNMYAAYAYAPDGLENPVEIGEKLVIEPRENGSLPLMLIDSTMSSPLQYGLGYQKRYSPVESNIMAEQSPYTRDIVLSFNYQKVMCIPHLMVMDSSYNTVYITFESYFDEGYDYYRTTYPYITAITYGMYLGAAGSRIGESSGIVPLIPYTFIGSDSQYESRYEFSGNGFSALKTSYITNSSNAGIILSCDNNGSEVTVSYNTPNATVATDDTGYRYRYCVNEPDRDEYYPVPLYVHDDSELWEYIRSSSIWWDISCVIDIRGKDIDDVREYCLKQIAYLGFPFVIAYADVQKAIGQQGVYLPVFDENGVTTGEYEEGAAALDLPNSDWTDGRQSGYDPNRPPTPEDGDTGDLGNFRNFTDTTHFNYPCTVYALTETNFRNFAEALNSLYLTDEDTTQMELDFKGSNPTDYIINCYALPFEPNFLSSSEVGVQIGPQTLLNITGKVVNTATSFYIDCGTKAIPKRGNFLDFEPYTHIELYLPMCGTVTLDPALVVGKTIKVVMYYNVLTNSATAAVYRLSELGDTLIATSTGEIGISIPFSAYNMGQYQNAIKATENAIKQNGLKVATGVATTAVGIAGALLAPETGGLSLALTGAALAGGSSALSAAMKGGELHYELEHIAPSVSQCSSADGSLAHVVAKTIPWLFIKRARMLQSYDEEVYAKTIGHACCINDILGGSEENPRTGLTVCSNIDTSNIPATVDEINAIKQALASGVIL